MKLSQIGCSAAFAADQTVTAIEIGEHESFGFVDEKADTVAQAMSALEKGLAEYFEGEEIVSSHQLRRQRKASYA